MQQRCPLLELPAELRLQIYSYIYTDHCEPLLILRDDTSLKQPKQRWFRHPGPALLQTCHTIHAEAAPILYERINFRVQIYIGDGWPQYQHAGSLDSSNPLFRRIQHVDVTLHLVDAAHIDPALQRLGMLASALEECAADLKTVKVTLKAVTSYNMAVTRRLVGRHRDLALKQLGEQWREGRRGDRLFRRMLMEGAIVAID